METDQKTPGQVFYETFWGTGWNCVPVSGQGNYERAVQAAIAHDRANQPAASGEDAAFWRDLLSAVVREQKASSRWIRPDDGNAPGHAHSRRGIWDNDNGSKAGTACAWCMAWNRALKALAAAPEAPKPSWVCPSCKADRFKEDCQGDRMKCPMSAVASMKDTP